MHAVCDSIDYDTVMMPYLNLETTTLPMRAVDHSNKQTLNATWNTSLQPKPTMIDCIIYV
ncbi:hypothetical protein Plhal304r1_c001g0000101 [Plasmopara halstedii]